MGAPACGDVMKLQIQVNGKGKIIDAKYKIFGYGSATASSSLATERLKRKTVKKALTIKKHKYHQGTLLSSCGTALAKDTIKDTLANYKLKQESTTGKVEKK